jgi:hypothetical protein
MSVAWKNFELRLARAWGGTRSGPLGKHRSDIDGIPLAIEAKRCSRYQLRREWLEQARRQSRQEGKPWLLVISEHNDRNPIAVADHAWLNALWQERNALLERNALVEFDLRQLLDMWLQLEKAGVLDGVELDIPARNGPERGSGAETGD